MPVLADGFTKRLQTIDVLNIRDSTLTNAIISVVLNHICYHKKIEEEQYDTIIRLFESSNAVKNIKNIQNIKTFTGINDKLEQHQGSRDLITLSNYMNDVKKRKRGPYQTYFNRPGHIPLWQASKLHLKPKQKKIYQLLPFVMR